MKSLRKYDYPPAKSTQSSQSSKRNEKNPTNSLYKTSVIDRTNSTKNSSPGRSRLPVRSSHRQESPVKNEPMKRTLKPPKFDIPIMSLNSETNYVIQKMNKLVPRSAPKLDKNVETKAKYHTEIKSSLFSTTTRNKTIKPQHGINVADFVPTKIEIEERPEQVVASEKKQFKPDQKIAPPKQNIKVQTQKVDKKETINLINSLIKEKKPQAEYDDDSIDDFVSQEKLAAEADDDKKKNPSSKFSRNPPKSTAISISHQNQQQQQQQQIQQLYVPPKKENVAQKTAQEARSFKIDMETVLPPGKVEQPKIPSQFSTHVSTQFTNISNRFTANPKTEEIPIQTRIANKKVAPEPLRNEFLRDQQKKKNDINLKNDVKKPVMPKLPDRLRKEEINEICENEEKIESKKQNEKRFRQTETYQPAMRVGKSKKEDISSYLLQRTGRYADIIKQKKSTKANDEPKSQIENNENRFTRRGFVKREQNTEKTVTQNIIQNHNKNNKIYMKDEINNKNATKNDEYNGNFDYENEINDDDDEDLLKSSSSTEEEEEKNYNNTVSNERNRMRYNENDNESSDDLYNMNDTRDINRNQNQNKPKNMRFKLGTEIDVKQPKSNVAQPMQLLMANKRRPRIVKNEDERSNDENENENFSEKENIENYAQDENFVPNENYEEETEQIFDQGNYFGDDDTPINSFEGENQENNDYYRNTNKNSENSGDSQDSYIFDRLVDSNSRVAKQNKNGITKKEKLESDEKPKLSRFQRTQNLNTTKKTSNVVVKKWIKNDSNEEPSNIKKYPISDKKELFMRKALKQNLQIPKLNRREKTKHNIEEENEEIEAFESQNDENGDDSSIHEEEETYQNEANSFLDHQFSPKNEPIRIYQNSTNSTNSNQSNGVIRGQNEQIKLFQVGLKSKMANKSQTKKPFKEDIKSPESQTRNKYMSESHVDVNQDEEDEEKTNEYLEIEKYFDNELEKEDSDEDEIPIVLQIRQKAKLNQNKESPQKIIQKGTISMKSSKPPNDAIEETEIHIDVDDSADTIHNNLNHTKRNPFTREKEGNQTSKQNHHQRQLMPPHFEIDDENYIYNMEHNGHYDNDDENNNSDENDNFDENIDDGQVIDEEINHQNHVHNFNDDIGIDEEESDIEVEDSAAVILHNRFKRNQEKKNNQFRGKVNQYYQENNLDNDEVERNWNPNNVKRNEIREFQNNDYEEKNRKQMARNRNVNINAQVDNKTPNVYAKVGAKKEKSTPTNKRNMFSRISYKASPKVESSKIDEEKTEIQIHDDEFPINNSLNNETNPRDDCNDQYNSHYKDDYTDQFRNYGHRNKYNDNIYEEEEEIYNYDTHEHESPRLNVNNEKVVDNDLHQNDNDTSQSASLQIAIEQLLAKQDKNSPIFNVSLSQNNITNTEIENDQFYNYNSCNNQQLNNNEDELPSGSPVNSSTSKRASYSNNNSSFSTPKSQKISRSPTQQLSSPQRQKSPNTQYSPNSHSPNMHYSPDVKHSPTVRYSPQNSIHSSSDNQERVSNQESSSPKKVKLSSSAPLAIECTQSLSTPKENENENSNDYSNNNSQSSTTKKRGSPSRISPVKAEINNLKKISSKSRNESIPKNLSNKTYEINQSPEHNNRKISSPQMMYSSDDSLVQEKLENQNSKAKRTQSKPPKRVSPSPSKQKRTKSPIKNSSNDESDQYAQQQPNKDDISGTSSKKVHISPRQIISQTSHIENSSSNQKNSFNNNISPRKQESSRSLKHVSLSPQLQKQQQTTISQRKLAQSPTKQSQNVSSQYSNEIIETLPKPTSPARQEIEKIKLRSILAAKRNAMLKANKYSDSQSNSSMKSNMTNESSSRNSPYNINSNQKVNTTDGLDLYFIDSPPWDISSNITANSGNKRITPINTNARITNDRNKESNIRNLVESKQIISKVTPIKNKSPIKTSLQIQRNSPTQASPKINSNTHKNMSKNAKSMNSHCPTDENKKSNYEDYYDIDNDTSTDISLNRIISSNKNKFVKLSDYSSSFIDDEHEKEKNAVENPYENDQVIKFLSDDVMNEMNVFKLSDLENSSSSEEEEDNDGKSSENIDSNLQTNKAKMEFISINNHGNSIIPLDMSDFSSVHMASETSDMSSDDVPPSKAQNNQHKYPNQVNLIGNNNDKTTTNSSPISSQSIKENNQSHSPKTPPKLPNNHKEKICDPPTPLSIKMTTPEQIRRYNELSLHDKELTNEEEEEVKALFQKMIAMENSEMNTSVEFARLMKDVENESSIMTDIIPLELDSDEKIFDLSASETSEKPEAFNDDEIKLKDSVSLNKEYLSQNHVSEGKMISQIRNQIYVETEKQSEKPKQAIHFSQEKETTLKEETHLEEEIHLEEETYLEEETHLEEETLNSKQEEEESDFLKEYEEDEKILINNELVNEEQQLFNNQNNRSKDEQNHQDEIEGKGIGNVNNKEEKFVQSNDNIYLTIGREDQPLNEEKNLFAKENFLEDQDNFQEEFKEEEEMLNAEKELLLEEQEIEENYHVFNGEDEDMFKEEDILAKDLPKEEDVKEDFENEDPEFEAEEDYVKNDEQASQINITIDVHENAINSHEEYAVNKETEINHDEQLHVEEEEEATVVKNGDIQGDIRKESDDERNKEKNTYLLQEEEVSLSNEEKFEENDFHNESKENDEFRVEYQGIRKNNNEEEEELNQKEETIEGNPVSFSGKEEEIIHEKFDEKDDSLKEDQTQFNEEEELPKTEHIIYHDDEDFVEQNEIFEDKFEKEESNPNDHFKFAQTEIESNETKKIEPKDTFEEIPNKEKGNYFHEEEESQLTDFVNISNEEQTNPDHFDESNSSTQSLKEKQIDDKESKYIDEMKPNSSFILNLFDSKPKIDDIIVSFSDENDEEAIVNEYENINRSNNVMIETYNEEEENIDNQIMDYFQKDQNSMKSNFALNFRTGNEEEENKVRKYNNYENAEDINENDEDINYKMIHDFMEKQKNREVKSFMPKVVNNKNQDHDFDEEESDIEVEFEKSQNSFHQIELNKYKENMNHKNRLHRVNKKENYDHEYSDSCRRHPEEEEEFEYSESAASNCIAEEELFETSDNEEHVIYEERFDQQQEDDQHPEHNQQIQQTIKIQQSEKIDFVEEEEENNDDLLASTSQSSSPMKGPLNPNDLVSETNMKLHNELSAEMATEQESLDSEFQILLDREDNSDLQNFVDEEKKVLEKKTLNLSQNLSKDQIEYDIEEEDNNDEETRKILYASFELQSSEREENSPLKKIQLKQTQQDEDFYNDDSEFNNDESDPGPNVLQDDIYNNNVIDNYLSHKTKSVENFHQKENSSLKGSKSPAMTRESSDFWNNLIEEDIDEIFQNQTKMQIMESPNLISQAKSQGKSKADTINVPKIPKVEKTPEQGNDSSQYEKIQPLNLSDEVFELDDDLFSDSPEKENQSNESSFIKDENASLLKTPNSQSSVQQNDSFFDIFGNEDQKLF